MLLQQPELFGRLVVGGSAFNRDQCSDSGERDWLDRTFS